MDTQPKVWRYRDASDFIAVARRVASTLGIDHSHLSALDTIKVVVARLDEVGLELAKETRITWTRMPHTIKSQFYYKVFVHRKEVYDVQAVQQDAQAVQQDAQAVQQDGQAVQQPETEMEL